MPNVVFERFPPLTFDDVLVVAVKLGLHHRRNADVVIVAGHKDFHRNCALLHVDQSSHIDVHVAAFRCFRRWSGIYEYLSQWKVCLRSLLKYDEISSSFSSIAARSGLT